MAKIKFVKGQKEIEVAAGVNLMQALLDSDLPVASSCGGEGVCCKCIIRVVEGRENLSPINGTEQDLRDIHDLARNERVSCQALVNGDVTVDTDYW